MMQCCVVSVPGVCVVCGVCVCADRPVCSSAETPLSLAVQCEPAGGEAIRVLVQGGAHIDFRATDGLTPLHKSVRCHGHAALLVSCWTERHLLQEVNMAVNQHACSGSQGSTFYPTSKTS